MFWAIIEMLRNEATYKLPLDKTTLRAIKMHTATTIDVEQYLKDCISEYTDGESGNGLFNSDNKFFWSASLLRRMEKYEILKEKVKTSCIEIKTPPESVILIALLHDLCKANYYKIDYRNAKNALGIWEKVPYYTVEDTIPYGHGEKSVMMITEYIKLTPEEKYAIRWHMGYTEPKEQYNTIGLAFSKYPIALLTHEADLEATYFFDT